MIKKLTPLKFLVQTSHTSSKTQDKSDDSSDDDSDIAALCG